MILLRRQGRSSGSFPRDACTVLPSYRPTALPLLLLIAAGCATAGENIPPRDDYREVAERLTSFIRHEMADKDLPALSIALVDDQEAVWARGFGYAVPEDSVAATAATVYRVGSVSKLFTDIGVMQLVERGALDLDAPVTDYLPDFKPENRYEGGAVPTLRQLTSHRAGLVREPPVGHYFDNTDVTLAATVESLNRTAMVYPPEMRVKYSNAGIATVGYVLERTQGEPFAAYLARSVLAPLGMTSSSFLPEPGIVQQLARAYMWTYDGRTFEAPKFQLGMAPAGSMYAPVTDLALFMSALFAGGAAGENQVLAPATIDSMFVPQFSPAGATSGYGIGFRVSQLDGHRRIGHGGAIYGFATDLAALPDMKLGVVSVTTMDGANTVVARVNEYALRLMLAARAGLPLPDAEVTMPVPGELASRLVGSYGPREGRVEITTRGDQVVAAFPRRVARLRLRGQDVITDDRLAYGTTIVPLENAIVVSGDTLARTGDRKPSPALPRWTGLIGEYGWDHNILYVFEKSGVLHALIEWFFVDPLEEISRDVFAFPETGGLYQGERLVFTRGDDGVATQVEAAGVVFRRRSIGGGSTGGSTFTIDPVRPVADLREEALAASPPPETGDFRASDLVELQLLDATIAYDIRYATTNNFMQAVFYDEPRAFMQRPAAEALARAHRALRPRGLGLLIHDAYRPWYVTKMFWDATPEDMKNFVANPANGSRHNRGAAVDLTLFDLASGEPIQMVGGYDEFSDRSLPDYWGGTSLQRWYRRLLREAMEEQGFNVYEYEWWHFDFQDWPRYRISNARFDEIATMP